jgi:hypothetical protein
MFGELSLRNRLFKQVHEAIIIPSPHDHRPVMLNNENIAPTSFIPSLVWGRFGNLALEANWFGYHRLSRDQQLLGVYCAVHSSF